MKRLLLLISLLAMAAMILSSCGCGHPDSVLQNNYEATCTVDGSQRRVCTQCSEVLEADIRVPALGHDPVTVNGENPTCSKDGKTDAVRCKKCNTTLTPSTTVAALGHEYGADDKCIRCSAQKYGVLHFTECDGGYSVRFGTFEGEEIVIPAEFNGKPVVAIDERGFYDRDGITSVYIPDSVRVIGNEAFLSCGAIEVVRIGTGVTTLGRGAFSTCKSLREVEFAEGCSIKEIPDNCFNSALALSEIDIPDTVQSIGRYAFSNTEIEILNLHEGLTYIGEYAFSSANLKEIYIPKSVEGIGFLAFEYSNLERATLPFVGASRTGEPMNNGSTAIDPGNFSYIGISSANVVEITDAPSIAANAFRDHDNIKAVIIGGSVKTIGEYAFYDCSSLMYVHLHPGVGSIGKNAFRNCRRLFEIKNESGYEFEIGSDSYGGIAEFARRIYFSGGSAYKLVENDFIFFFDSAETILVDYVGKDKVVKTPKLDSYVKTYSIGNSAFANKGIEEIIISNLVTAIGESAFYGNRTLVRVTFEEDSKLTSIGKDAFSTCTALKSLSIPGGVTVIEERTFYNCSSLSSLNIPSSVLRINRAFEGCRELVLDLPMFLESFASFDFNGYKNAELIDGVYYVDGWAFATATCPSSVTIKDGTVGIGENAFWSSDYTVRELTVPTSVKWINDSAFSMCGDLVRLTIPFLGNNIKDRESNPMYRTGLQYMKNSLKYLNISYGDYVHEYALDGYTALEEVIICHSVTEIGNNAFRGCTSLKNVTFEGNSQLKKIGDGAFRNCKSLGSVAFPAGVTEIPNGCLAGCTSIDAVEIGEGITSIGYTAFTECTNIKYIVIPKSMTSIMHDAFKYCTSLTHVYYRGSESEWSAISGGVVFGSGVTVEYNYSK